MVVINLAVQQKLHRFDDPSAAHECAVDVVLERIADRKADHAPVAVATAGGYFGELAIGPGDLAEQVDLLNIKKTLDDQEAVAVKLLALLVVRCEGHGRSPSGVYRRQNEMIRQSY